MAVVAVRINGHRTRSPRVKKRYWKRSERRDNAQI
ncbi:uncharacterized protein G2W53_010085 [Senna tora]|uniref:Uncharacterized protein n=1 Tax=Senna tora TaxID=362788 RepID=A0A835C8X0_9FABA|nr:uncharacterized protein G2W53_010085 [Senna tora]